MVPRSWLIVMWKTSTPALKAQISLPVLNCHRRIVPSRDPDTTISLSEEMAAHQTWEEIKL